MMGIDPEGTRLSVLAERAQVAKQTATALVDKLERAGYVERVPDPTDGRARLVRLTARAEAAIPHARAEEDRIEEESAPTSARSACSNFATRSPNYAASQTPTSDTQGRAVAKRGRYLELTRRKAQPLWSSESERHLRSGLDIGAAAEGTTTRTRPRGWDGAPAVEDLGRRTAGADR